VSFSLQYNTNLLKIVGVSLGRALPASWALTNVPSPAGTLQLSLGGSVPLSPGTNTIATLTAIVPWCAPYGLSGSISISSPHLNGGAIPAIGDSAVQVAAFLGDAVGNGSNILYDAELIRRVELGGDSGFAAYPLLDPVIIGDVVGYGQIEFGDVVAVDQYYFGNSVPFIPALPAPSLSISMVINQALISWPQCADGYVLQQSPTLGTQANWTTVTNGTVLMGDQQAVFVTPASTTQFYRLNKP
jgi:hypothetical protein